MDELKQEQRMLADEIERLFRVFDERLQSLASRTHELGPEQVDREADVLRAQQDALRRALRRLDAAAKQTNDLERELEEWQSRSEDAGARPAVPLHADHPNVRSEIIRSELAARGIEIPDDDLAASGQEDEAEEEDAADRSESVEESAPALTDENGEEPFEPLPTTDVAHLVAAIRDASREAERWHALPTDEHDDDALAQVKHLKELHAILKRVDREQGIERDRIELAVSPREVH